MPLQATSGAASYDAFGGGVAAVPNYIEDVFSTWLYAGNGSTQTITNGIDLSGKGGLVWIKERTRAGTRHSLFDTVRGRGSWLSSDGTEAAQAVPADKAITSFNSDGFSLGPSYYGTENSSGQAIASWTFRKQPKFFDVVTYTGNGALPNQLISHSLGAVPGCIIIKATSAARNWIVWHRGNGTTNYASLSLNLTAASGGSVGSGDLPTATQFKPGAFFDPDYNNGNETGVTYVAYLFAHNAGGFGLTGTDNVISCGSFTTNSAGEATVNLEYEPQWFLWKQSNAATDWYVADNMRGWNMSRYDDLALRPNLANADYAGGYGNPTANGFFVEDQNASAPHIYIAIRRGPMKVPTDGTKVFAPIVSSASAGTPITTGFPVDVQFPIYLDTSSTISDVVDRLRSASSTTTPSGLYLGTSTINAEASSTVTRNWGNTGFDFPNYYVGARTLFLNFRRAPGYFDEVCYTGNSSNQTITHNLGAAPQLIIAKKRSGTGQWPVYAQPLGATKYLQLNTSSLETTGVIWNDTAPTSSVFSVGADGDSNLSGATYVAYLFATCPGVSKVTNFTGTGTLQTINCGFTAGARFVLIKRTDIAGGWYVWDSARGLSSSTDPYFLLNSAAAEVTSTNWVDTTSTGFQVTAASGNNVNISGASYIALAIA